MKQIILFLLLLGHVCLAQEKPRTVGIRARVARALADHTDKELLMNTPRGTAYLFSITLSFDKNGKVDSVHYPKKIPENVRKVMKLDLGLAKRIKDQNAIYEIYANKMVFIPILYRNLYDGKLDYQSGFLESFQNLLPNINIPSIKQWVVIDPLIETFHHPIY